LEPKNVFTICLNVVHRLSTRYTQGYPENELDKQEDGKMIEEGQPWRDSVTKQKMVLGCSDVMSIELELTKIN